MTNTENAPLEAKISDLIVKFERDYMGRGPEDIRTYVLGDMILVRLKRVLTRAEHNLAQSGNGARLVKESRMQLLENGRPLLEEIIREAAGRQVLSLHTDISTRTGERVIIFTLDSAVK